MHTHLNKFIPASYSNTLVITLFNEAEIITLTQETSFKCFTTHATCPLLKLKSYVQQLKPLLYYYMNG